MGKLVEGEIQNLLETSIGGSRFKVSFQLKYHYLRI